MARRTPRTALASLLATAFVLGGSALVGCSSDAGTNLGGAGGDGSGTPSVTTSGDPTSFSNQVKANAQSCGSPAPSLFGNALCLCGNFDDIGNLMVTGTSPQNLGSVGVNGLARVINNTDVQGGWATGGEFSAIGNVQVGKSLYVQGDATVTGNVDVKENLEVGGGLAGFGRLAVGGELRQRGDGRVIGYQKVGGVGSYAAASTPPCGCDGPGLLDVGAAVAAAKNGNDNGAKGVSTGALKGIGVSDLTLAGGKYFFDGTAGIGLTRIRVTEPSSVYIEGDLEQIGAGLFELEPTASLDLYVSGNVKTIGYTQAGDKAHPEAFRLYIGGNQEVSLSIGAQIFRGSIYAPKANLKYVGHTRVVGGLFAHELTGIGNLEIGGARPEKPAACGGSGSGGSAGRSTTGGSSAGSSSGSSAGSSSGASAGGGAGGQQGTGGGFGSEDPSYPEPSVPVPTTEIK